MMETLLIHRAFFNTRGTEDGRLGKCVWQRHERGWEYIQGAQLHTVIIITRVDGRGRGGI
jgi:hypothetical protein